MNGQTGILKDWKSHRKFINIFIKKIFQYFISIVNWKYSLFEKLVLTLEDSYTIISKTYFDSHLHNVLIRRIYF